ncbi:porphobilinogen synthase [Treponema saccharophilum]|uniref:Delta-aminolevulinic acid dehydratase n=1 Tax=Treponema saccharophilum DSM 2985 TaxID=907348 RepID=H7EPI2_9SPIR|nr:porphobilinogen synthase [Treponema saccharophilum]EIC00383.1 porphobilinogen synthase [Treponema saccharophilum DSM 2985]BDC94919.1 delta-aminolevulinic acid dehydratase [Treponema saccharophilum]
MRNRLRRLRMNEGIRAMVRENAVSADDLVYPVFVAEGNGVKKPIDSMPGIFQFSLDTLGEEITRMVESGVRAVLLFGIPSKKDEFGSESWNDNGVVQNAIRFIKKEFPEVIVIADICLCEYTSHGHCGLVSAGIILNDATLPLLSRMAVSCAKAGADIVAPSDMMDGRVAFMRDELDKNGFQNVAIMAYSAKFASGYYSPFRDAADSAPQFGDRKTYQMDCANGREAMREIEADIAEGCDYIMVKPALAYLDVVKEASQRFDVPLVTYNVSGEYAMVKAAAKNGWIDERRIVMENMVAFKRAGAKIIITYHAIDVATWLREEAECRK